MSAKYFPIQTSTACQLKWTWSTLYLYGGSTASCHRTAFNEVTLDTFDDFHNTPNKIQERKAMLAGQWPENSCQYCKKIEDAGGFSDRMLHLNIPDLNPPELDRDSSAVIVTPRILEVFFNNTCNLACVYCKPSLSSRINQEYRKFGNFSQGIVELKATTVQPDHKQMVEKFWAWMHINSKELRRLNILGGEPFYQEEFDECLEYFQKNPHPELVIGIITNLMVPEEKLKTYVDKFKWLLQNKHLKRVDISCSIDCLGPEQEYVRYGIDLDLWVRNFEMLLRHKWMTLNISQTISVLTIKTMHDLIVKLNEWKKIRSIGHYFSVVTPHPSYLDPAIFGSGPFEDDFNRSIAIMQEENQQDLDAKKYMQGILTQIKSSTRNDTQINALKIFLDEKDRRRGTNWKHTFPWLEKEIIDVV